MRKITKVCLSLAIIMAVVGIVSLFAGMALGAKPEDFLQVSIGNGGITVGEGLRLGRETEWKEDSEVNTESISVKQLTDIKISIASGNVEIYLTEDKEEIALSSNRNMDVCKVKDDTLVIEDNKIKDRLELKLYLPEKMWKEISLKLGACSAYIEDLQAEEISLELGAGEVGIGFLYCSKKADLQVGAGELNIESCDGKKLQLECGVGSMAVVLAGKESDYDCQLKCGIGTIMLQDRLFTGMSWENNVNNKAAKQVQAECGMGELFIGFADEG